MIKLSFFSHTSQRKQKISTIESNFLILCRGEFGDPTDKESFFHLEPLDKQDGTV